MANFHQWRRRIKEKRADGACSGIQSIRSEKKPDETLSLWFYSPEYILLTVNFLLPFVLLSKSAV